MIKHFKRWNKWRKGSADSTFHKILVLLGIIKSPSYYMVNGFHDAIREETGYCWDGTRDKPSVL